MLETHLTSTVSDLAASAVGAPLYVLVIGGGTSGVTAAISLAERGLSVALSEAGPLLLIEHINSTDPRFKPSQASELRRRVECTPELGGGGRFWPLVGCLGGRGMFWNDASPCTEAQDFAAWPIGSADLQNDFRWAERERGATERDVSLHFLPS